jgi:hypothetical protein
MAAVRKLFETESKPFLIKCDAGESGQLCSSTQHASITVGQRILRDGAEEMWDSVVVLCQEEQDGALAIRVVLCHPDWDEPREIACLRSWVGTPVPRTTALEFHLGQDGGS